MQIDDGIPRGQGKGVGERRDLLAKEKTRERDKKRKSKKEREGRERKRKRKKEKEMLKEKQWIWIVLRFSKSAEQGTEKNTKNVPSELCIPSSTREFCSSRKFSVGNIAFLGTALSRFELHMRSPDCNAQEEACDLYEVKLFIKATHAFQELPPKIGALSWYEIRSSESMISWLKLQYQKGLLTVREMHRRYQISPEAK
ncbi:Zinc finger CCCH domain-containing protein 13, partial [Ophiophagus hannah]